MNHYPILACFVTLLGVLGSYKYGSKDLYALC